MSQSGLQCGPPLVVPVLAIVLRRICVRRCYARVVADIVISVEERFGVQLLLSISRVAARRRLLRPAMLAGTSVAEDHLPKWQARVGFLTCKPNSTCPCNCHHRASNPLLAPSQFLVVRFSPKNFSNKSRTSGILTVKHSRPPL